MNLSVIIPCFNAVDTIGYQLEALSKQSWSEPWEVIVSDNGSTDESRKIVERYREHFPNLRVVDSSDRKGAAHARNVGALAATGDVFLFCDADDEVAPGWLMAMGEALVSHGLVTSRLDSQKLNAPWLQESWENGQKNGPLQFNPNYLPAGGSFSLGVKRSLHEAVRGFDESVIGVEDIDYCWRIQLAGSKLHFVHHAAVYYRYPRKFRRMYSQMRGIGENSAFLYKRYQSHGMPKLSNPWKKAIFGWRWLVARLPRIRNKRDFAEWVRAFGLRVGRIKGSIKHRVIYI